MHSILKKKFTHSTYSAHIKLFEKIKSFFSLSFFYIDFYYIGRIEGADVRIKYYKTLCLISYANPSTPLTHENDAFKGPTFAPKLRRFYQGSTHE